MLFPLLLTSSEECLEKPGHRHVQFQSQFCPTWHSETLCIPGGGGLRKIFLEEEFGSQIEILLCGLRCQSILRLTSLNNYLIHLSEIKY